MPSRSITLTYLESCLRKFSGASNRSPTENNQTVERQAWGVFQ